MQNYFYPLKALINTVGKNIEAHYWLKITEAAFSCLTATRSGLLKISLRNTLQVPKYLNPNAAVRPLVVYQFAGVKTAKVTAVSEVLPATSSPKREFKAYTFLFTGHMLDKPGRPEPRFPKEMEGAAREAIRIILQGELKNVKGNITGIAGGACGGDILFHEICEELGIQSEMYLALPRKKYIAESVAFAGPEWIDRFNKLYDKLPAHILSPATVLPRWLSKKEAHTIWERNNVWMLYQALRNGGQHMSVVALWNGKGGDAPGGTEHMLNEAGKRGAKRLIIDSTKLMTGEKGADYTSKE